MQALSNGIGLLGSPLRAAIVNLDLPEHLHHLSQAMFTITSYVPIVTAGLALCQHLAMVFIVDSGFRGEACLFKVTPGAVFGVWLVHAQRYGKDRGLSLRGESLPFVHTGKTRLDTRRPINTRARGPSRIPSF